MILRLKPLNCRTPDVEITEEKCMKDYEKPYLDVIYLNCDVITDSCGSSSDTETPGACVIGYDPDNPFSA